jgi:hypothetical protein
VVLSCTHQSQLEEEALHRYVRTEGNGLIKAKEADGFHLAMIWRPTDLIAKQQAVKGTKIEFDSLASYFSNYLYFNLEITKDGKDLETSFANDPSSFAEKISFLSSGLAENIRIISEDDTIPALECIYSRSYGMGASQCLIVLNKPKKDFFQIEVKGYPIGFGKELFSFHLSDIQNAPRLKTNLL